MKKLKTLASLFVAGSIFASSVASSYACTALMITDKSGKVYSAKTMEYSTNIPSQFTYIPAGTKMVSITPAGKDGLTFNTQYPIIGVASSFIPVANAKQAMVIEAVNNQGLSLSTNELTGSTSPKIANPVDSKTLAVNDLASYLLGNFKTVAEVKQALQSGSVQVWLPKVPFAGNVELPDHYVLFDKTGAGIVIEYTDGLQNVYDNPVGVATNGPDFPWHLKNLNNYAFLTNLDKNTGKFNKLNVVAPDSGSALAGLPSIQISAGRFVKAAFYTNYVRKASTPEDAVVTLAHIMNNFDRPYDLTIDPPGFSGDAPAGSKTSSEVSLYTWMNDKDRNHYYIRTIHSMNFTTFEIDKLASVKSVVVIPLKQINDKNLDGTQMILDAANKKM
jgi:choloylglycine hydrolase